VKTSTSGGGGARSTCIESDVALIIVFYPVGPRPIKVPDPL
jgi:hypothetical protein